MSTPDPIQSIPEENLPGHHPEVEQDKPQRPPRPKAREPKERPPTVPDPARFAFDFDPRFASVSRVFGVTAQSAWIEVAGERVTISFGPWQIVTQRANVVDADVTGPYAWWKVVGPPRISLRDLGITLATNARRGVCIRLQEPVKGIDALGVVKHRGITVTPCEPEQLVEALTRG